MAETTENTSPPFSQVWQLPLLALSLLTFGAGLFLASGSNTEPETPVGTLDQLAQQVEAGRYDEALRTAEVLAEPKNFSEIPDDLHPQYHLLVGDAASRRQRSQSVVTETSHRRVVQAYTRAQELDAQFEPDQAERFADSLAALNRVPEALAVLSELGEDGAAQRQKLLRRPIEQALNVASDELDPQKISRAIDQLLNEPHLSLDNEVWATARQAELLMRSGRTPDAIDMLLRRLARLQDDPDAPLAELKLKLAQAYFAESELANAERWLLRAQEDADPEDLINAEINVTLGEIRFSEGNAAEAVEYFAEVVRLGSDVPSYPEALIGKAESEARLGRHERALSDYAEAAAIAADRPGRSKDLATRLAQSLQTQHDLRFTQSDYQQALAYLKLQESLYAEPPAELLLSLAVTHHRQAQKLAGEDDQAAPPDADTGGADPTDPADPVLARKIATHHAAAADAYRAHANAVVATDDDAFGQSLWMAGTLYDQAGLHREAVAVFDRYIEQRPDDPRRLRAIFRLAQAHRADGQPANAIPLYTQLIEENPNSPEAYASLVPLARSYLAQGPDFIDRAERVLLSVVTDHEALRPESTEFREALTELGQLYYRRGEEGDFERAIARLSEVVERYGREAPMPELLFQLGDAYRKSVHQVDERLETALPPSRRAELASERATRLHEARESFDKVILIYEARDPRTLTELHDLYLRNSYFYRADCAYELGHYEGPEGSIALYEKAVQRYDKDPAALVGLVQIVNSYAELGDWDKARTANERAKVYLEAIPEQAFDDPNLPMGREHWQRWLDWSSELALGDPTAQAE
ncbi:MAG: tetratricopeptide repeat protein [Phycisphaeraceae bacterium]